MADASADGAAAAQPSAKKSHKRLLNPNTVTAQSIAAFSLLHPNITRLQTTPPYHILILTPSAAPSSQSSQPRTTCLLSGGGDGHYPAHAGYIGAGMLTAAVSGNVFVSPSAEAVAAAVEGVRRTNKEVLAVDVLLIVKNYTGDKLNFRLALHLLSQTHHSQPTAWTDMVVVGDDVALPRGQGIAGRRGLAGTLLVHKLAGAAAAEGRSGQQVKTIAEEVAARLCTLGVAFTSCSMGGCGSEAEMGEDEMELGLGIHGESGISRQKLESVDVIVRRMVDVLLSHDTTRDYFWREAAADDNQMKTKDEQEAKVRVILLVNNLSGMQQHEMNVVTQLALTVLTGRQIRVERLVAGTLMTAWDMRGFSLTLLRLPADDSKRQQWLQWFNAETDAPAWPACSDRPPALQPPPSILLSQQPSPSSSSSAVSSPLVVPLLRSAAEALVLSTDELNALDSQSGDGDCGSTFKQGAELLLLDLHSLSSSSSVASASSSSVLDLSSLPALFRSLRKYSAAMGGTSGAICSLLFLAAASSLASSPSPAESAPSLQAARALRSAADEVSGYSGAKPGDRTLLDALIPALDAAVQAAQPSGETTAERVLAMAVEVAVAGMESTKGMVARAGRASYVRAEVVKDVDPGAKAICIVLQAMHRACQDTSKQ